MLARIIETTLKGGKRQEAITIIQNELVPFLQKQSGFVGYETCTRESDPNYTLSITLWRDKQDAENCYATPAYAALVAKLRPLLNADLHPVFYNVEISTAHKISVGKAA